MGMRERIARAMCVATSARDPDDLFGGPHPLGQWLDEGTPWWKGYEEAADAALASIPEHVDP